MDNTVNMNTDLIAETIEFLQEIQRIVPDEDVAEYIGGLMDRLANEAQFEVEWEMD